MWPKMKEFEPNYGFLDANRDKLVKSTFTPSTPNTETQAFKDEAQQIRDAGGLPNDKLYNQRNSPGENMLPPPLN